MATTEYDLSANCCCGGGGPDLPIVDCSECNPAPLRYNFTIDGATDDLCTECNVFNGGYIVEWVSGCLWEQSAYVQWCANTKVFNRVRLYFSGGQMYVQFHIITGGGGFTWLVTKSTTMDCQGRTVIDTIVANNTACDMSAIIPFNVDAI